MYNQKKHPHSLYGTAWKEEKSSALVFLALQEGFRGIDTANQRKHYFEEAVGLGIKKYLALQICSRQDLFLQTKFTFARGQDHRKPYNENDVFAKQVAASFASSLKNLNTDYLDSYILHGPYHNIGISDEDIETWAAMEEIYNNGQTRNLGVSNVSAQQLVTLYQNVNIKPKFVQNRCYARTGWDKSVRQICQKEGITYQGFSLLTANAREMSESSILPSLSKKYQKTPAQIIFRFAYQLGMMSLTGTTNKEHMHQDLDIMNFELNATELEQIEGISIN